MELTNLALKSCYVQMTDLYGFSFPVGFSLPREF